MHLTFETWINTVKVHSVNSDMVDACIRFETWVVCMHNEFDIVVEGIYTLLENTV